MDISGQPSTAGWSVVGGHVGMSSHPGQTEAPASRLKPDRFAVMTTLVSFLCGASHPSFTVAPFPLPARVTDTLTVSNCEVRFNLGSSNTIGFQTRALGPDALNSHSTAGDWS